ncbi:hypothetical protein Micbo1qcDRAFT_167953 [Microdochium bolleyi]|uniref:Zn(2)-C6 fungal-type domain-containing protein n=1 Tax=Microdochium bolleyi TaxID=196109 RepID=A0A136IPM5_9PEZI|nr:hypothetical protein Micbo1qcDRAFT_167953 [Microdochium bolleyi]
MADHSPSPSRARALSAASSPTRVDTGPMSRNKRRKYTAVACDECRRRKLKCLPGVVDGPCQRCAARGITDCSYLVTVPSLRRSNNKDESQGAVLALSKDVQLLKATLNNFMTVVGNGGAAEEPESPLSLHRQRSGQEGGPAQQQRAVLQERQPGQEQRSPAGAQERRRSHGPRQEKEQRQHQLQNRSTEPVATSPFRHPDLHPSYTAPEEPRFLGPTRPAYSLQVGERALSRLGIPLYEVPPASGQQTPARSPTPQDVDQAKLFWERCDCAEFARLMNVFQEEIESIYPCIESEYLVDNAAEIIELARLPDNEVQQAVQDRDGRVSVKDLQLAQLTIALALIVQGHGTTPTSSKMIASVERSILNILEPSRELKSLQLLSILSIYYFQADQDLLAWRTIGLAAREALVIGLHRKATLFESFRDQHQRDMAVKIFWTIYVLDRRWSYGTSLSFALVDRDIDPELPEPGDKCPYLQCMLGYGRLSTALWELLASSNSHSNTWIETTTSDMDIKTQEWLDSIPSELRLRHPRLNLAGRPQPPVLQRLRALLYLRGNHFRILIYRHYLLGPNRIKSAPDHAWLAVEIAQDSIQVLVHLNDSSDIYRRQQAAFNYFLVSALAVLFLAVCNDPETFAAPCKKSLHSAIELLRYFSRHSGVSRRLWTTVRRIVPRLRGLEVQREEERLRRASLVPGQTPTNAPGGTADPACVPGPVTSPPGNTIRVATTPLQSVDNNTGGGSHGNIFSTAASMDVLQPVSATDSYYAQTAQSMPTPDFSDFGSQLLGLYEMFEQGQVIGTTQPQQMSMPPEGMDWWSDGMGGEAPNFLSAEQGVFTMNFNCLI